MNFSSPNIIGKILLFVSVLVLVVIVVIACRALGGVAPLPSDFEALIALGPFVTALGTALFSAKFIIGNERSDKNATVATLIMAIAAIALCGLLTTFQKWAFHLLIMALLFFVFIIWDFYIVKCDISKNAKRRVIIANKFINMPTIFATLGGLFFLYLLKENGYLGSLAPYFINGSITQCNDQHIIYCASSISLTNAYINAFVHGLTTFHLFASAVGYFLSPHLTNLYKKINVIENDLMPN